MNGYDYPDAQAWSRARSLCMQFGYCVETPLSEAEYQSLPLELRQCFHSVDYWPCGRHSAHKQLGPRESIDADEDIDLSYLFQSK